MTFLHHSQTAHDPKNSADNSVSSGSTTGGSTGKRRMSLFSFGLGGLGLTTTKNKALSTLSTSPPGLMAAQSGSVSSASKPPQVRSPSASFVSRALPLLPGISPVLETDSLSENPGSHIFERSVQDLTGLVKQEDYIPPALDATAEILSDLATDLDNVEMVYSLRRNSSVIGLNMALGRPFPPLRKNSVYLASQLNNANGNTLASLSSLTQLQPQPFLPGSHPTSSQTQQTQLPVSPPKLMSSRLSVSFYSYADMINNDEFSRRPSLMHAYSHGVVPSVGRKLSVASNHSTPTSGPAGSRERSPTGSGKYPRKLSLAAGSPSDTPSQLSKQFKDRSRLVQPMSKMFDEATELPRANSSPKKFLISPESSDSEDQEEIFHPTTSMGRKPLRRKSVASNASFAHSAADNDSFVSSSVGDCIRKCTTELENN